MTVSPICEVRDGLDPYQSTTAGVNVTPGNTISIRLVSTTDVTDWYLQVTGTDELSTPPVLTGVNPLTNLVASPSTVVTFTMPAGKSRSLLFSTSTSGTGGPLTSTFGIYALTDHGRRVGSVGEMREGNAGYGWAAIVNPLIRTGAGVIYYNDATVSPTLGSNTVQGALDALKTTLRGRNVAATAPTNGQVYVWNSVASQWEPGAGGGGGTLDGDVTGPALTNLVASILGMPSPDPAYATVGSFFKVRDAWVSPFTTPRAIVSDGTYLYVAESAQSAPGTGIVWKVQPTDTALSIAASVNLANTVPDINFVRDLAQDATYLYAACWTTGHIAIIDKATMTVAGWGYAGEYMGEVLQINQATSVCADGLGNFFVSVQGIRFGPPPGVQKFVTSACLGQAPGTVLATATYASGGKPRKVRYGGGKLWVTRGDANVSRIDPVAMTLEASDAWGLGSDAMSALYAFGSIWVSQSDGTIVRADPSTLAIINTISNGTGDDLDEMIVGPKANGTPDARIMVTYPLNQWMGVVDPDTDTWETTLNPSGIATNRLDGMGVIDGRRVWTASFINFGDPGEYDLWWVYPSGGVYTVGGVAADLELFYGPAFTAGGDLSGTDTRQLVRSIQGVLAPDPTTVVDGYAVTVSYTIRAFSPRRIAVDPIDGTLWVVDNSSPWLYNIDPTTGDILTAYNISVDNESVTRCRDVAVDALNVYVTTWTYQHVIKISKNGGNPFILGYAYVNGGNAMFVALDGADGLYVTVGPSIGAPYGIQKFSVASMDATSPFGYTCDAICEPGTGVRQVVSGGGFMWVGCGDSANVVYKVDPTTMTVVATSPDLGFTTVDMVYGLGGLWVTMGTNRVYQLDVTTLAVLNTVIPSNDTMGICIGPNAAGTPDTWIWVTSNFDNTLWGIDPASPSSPAVTMVSTVGADEFDGIVQTGTKLWVALRDGVAGTVGLRQFDPVTQTQTLLIPLNVKQLRYTVSGSFTAGGDLAAASPASQTVIGLQGRTLASTAPAGGQVITWNGCTAQWEPATPSAGGGSGSPYFYHRVGGYLDQQYNFISNPPTVGQALRVSSNTTRPMGMFYDNRSPFGNTPNGPIVWIGRQYSGDVFWFDTYYWMSKTIPLTTQGASAPVYGLLPRYIVQDVNNSMIWVAGDRTIQKIDQVTEEVKLTITLGLSSNAVYGLIADPLNNRILAAPGTLGLARIYSIDATTGALTSTNIPAIPAGHCYGIYLYGGFLYWFGGSTVYRLDPLTYALLGSAAYGTTMNGEKRIVYYGGYLFFTSPGFAGLWRLDTVTMTVTSLALTGGVAQGLCLDIYTPAIWVATTTTRGFNKVITPTGTMTNSTLVTVAGTDTPYDCIYDPLYTYVYGVCDGTSTTGAYLCRWRPYGTTQSLLLRMSGGMEWFDPVAIGGDLSGSGASPTVAKIQNVSVASTAPSNGQHLVYNGGASRWEPTTVSAGGATLSVVLGESASADAPMLLDESRSSASPGLMAYTVRDGWTSDAQTTLESGANWPSPTQPYAFDACAVKPDLYLVAYRMVVGATTYLRLRAISYDPSTGSLTVGTAYDLEQDVGSNEVAYVSCCRVTNYNFYAYAGTVAWANPTTSKGYIAGVLISGTTITLTNVVTFSATAVLGTAVAGHERGSPQNGAVVLAWGDVSTNTGQSRWFDLQLSGAGFLTAMGSNVKFTNMTAANIGQPTLRTYSPQGRILWIAYGLNERRVNAGQISPGSSYELLWYLNPVNPPATNNISEARVDGFGQGGGDYILDASQYGTGDFLSPGNAAFIVTGTRVGYTNNAYLIQTQMGDSDYPDGSFTQIAKLIGAQSPSWGTNIRNTTIRAIGPDTFIFSYYSDNANDAMYYAQGKISPQGGLVVNMTPLDNAAYSFYISPLGTPPQHFALPFRITDYFYGTLSSHVSSGTNTFLFALRTLRDPRSGFIGFLQSSGVRGDTRVVTLPGGLHTFSATQYWRPGQPIYLNRHGLGFTITPHKGNCLVGIATGTANQILVQKPARVF